MNRPHMQTLEFFQTLAEVRAVSGCQTVDKKLFSPPKGENSPFRK